ncbi:helix-turn-helix transcriptional regulator [Clostridium sp. KNHs205]|uniref:helix-turn-helix transcriptional regulator n=1 Tax=Clostridium sp. KNHs205 TaxID=1449050 RepID=UPI00051C5F9A|nr:helix-turn-helix transcriptional regulator [Clostridium sp. KNHs205]
MTKEDLFAAKGDSIKLKFIRNNLGLSIDEFSKKTEINLSFLNLLEKGYLPLSARDKRKIGEAFDLQENWFDIVDVSEFQESNDISSTDNNELKESTKSTEATIPADKTLSLHNITINSGDALKTIRTAMGLSRKDIADAIDITSVQIGYIETGKRTLTDKVKNKLNEYFRTNSIKLSDLYAKDQEIIKQLLESKEELQDNKKDSLTDEEILNQVRMIKSRKEYTQAAISDKSGVNRSQFSLIENGKMQLNRRIREKLLDFIESEAELDNSVTRQEVSGKTTAVNYSELTVVPENKDIIRDFTKDFTTNKYELIKVIDSMKKSRDELILNINMLEKVVSYM